MSIELTSHSTHYPGMKLIQYTSEYFCLSLSCKAIMCRPWARKRVTLFLILAFLGRFLYFLYRWKQEGMLYKTVNKIYHFTLTVSLHYLLKTKMTYKQHILKSIIRVHSFEPVICNFCRNSSNVHLFQFFNQPSIRFFTVFFTKFLGLCSNSTYLILRSNRIK